MHIDPLLPPLVGVVLSVLLLGLALRRLGQPEIIGYLIAGALIGPHGFAWLTDAATIEHLGTLGVTLLLFFIGMEVSPTKLARGWRVALVGTLLQILASVGLVWLIGLWFDWSLARVVLLGFVVSLSSTAVVLKLLKDRGELDTPCGRDVLMVLLAQDLAVVPMLILLSLLGGKLPAIETLLLQALGAAVLIVGLGGWLATRERIAIPLLRWVRGDREFQVFAALLICFGLAFITGLLQLSTALGALLQATIISEYAYQTTVAVIAISLILSAPWIALVRRLTTGPVG